MKPRQIWGFLTVAVPVPFLLNGCTALGYIVGSNLDNNSRTYDYVQVTDPVKLSEGSWVMLTTKQDTSYSGEVASIETTASSEPDSTQLTVVAEKNSVVIRWHEVRSAQLRVTTNSPKIGRQVGVCLGLALDVAAIVAIGNSLKGVGF